MSGNGDSITIPKVPEGIPSFTVVGKEVCAYVLWSPTGCRFSFHCADNTELGAFSHDGTKWTFHGKTDLCALAFVDFVAENLKRPTR